jgi:toxin ParE1/3/4
MADYELSLKAEHDLTEIYIFSYEKFGEAKADAYLIGLEGSFSHLADNPLLGRKIDHIRKGYLRYEYIGRSIFYKRTKTGIKIMRVLHGGMSIDQHLPEP